MSSPDTSGYLKQWAEMRYIMERANAWNKYDSKKKAEVFDFAEQYRQFISKCKTERECVKEGVRLLKEAGYADLKDVIADNRTLKAGDKVYAVNMNKALVAFNIGEEPISAGMNILGAHIDSPRLDIKQNPLYEETGLVLLDTHYYGGIKKYQWVAIPLAIHGVVALKNGTTVEIVIGEDMSDTVVGVSDLLIHLASEQMEKKGAKVVEGEALDILVGSMPQEKEECDKEAKDAVKKNILAILKDKYGIEEEDFLSAELCVVPAGPARDYGFDKSMIMGYGHDDKVCAYPSLIAQLESVKPEKTSVCILVDKEERQEKSLSQIPIAGALIMFFGLINMFLPDMIPLNIPAMVSFACTGAGAGILFYTFKKKKSYADTVTSVEKEEIPYAIKEEIKDNNLVNKTKNVSDMYDDLCNETMLLSDFIGSARKKKKLKLQLGIKNQKKFQWKYL